MLIQWLQLEPFSTLILDSIPKLVLDVNPITVEKNNDLDTSPKIVLMSIFFHKI